MSSDWWPTPLQHIPAENPWEEDDVVVAEIRSFDEQPAVHRRTFSFLVPVDEVDAVRKNLAGFDHSIRASGPPPSPFRDRSTIPSSGSGLRNFRKRDTSRWSCHGVRMTRPFFSSIQ